MPDSKIPHQDLVEDVIDERIERYVATGFYHNFVDGGVPERFSGDLAHYDLVDDALVSTTDARTPGVPVEWLEFDTAVYKAAIVVEVDLDEGGWVYVDQVRQLNPNVHYIYGRRGTAGTQQESDTLFYGPWVTNSVDCDVEPLLMPASQIEKDDQNKDVYIRRVWLSLVSTGYEFVTTLHASDPESETIIREAIADENSDQLSVGLGMGSDMRKRTRFGIGGEAGAAKIRSVRIKNLVAGARLKESR